MFAWILSFEGKDISEKERFRKLRADTEEAQPRVGLRVTSMDKK